MNNDLIAIIVEGQTELAIMTLLLERNSLKYDKDDLLDNKIITVRKGRNFAKRYLNKGFGSRKIKIIRILDSKKKSLFFHRPIVRRSVKYKIYILDQKLKFWISFITMNIENILIILKAN